MGEIHWPQWWIWLVSFNTLAALVVGLLVIAKALLLSSVALLRFLAGAKVWSEFNAFMYERRRAERLAKVHADAAAEGGDCACGHPPVNHGMYGTDACEYGYDAPDAKGCPCGGFRPPPSASPAADVDGAE